MTTASQTFALNVHVEVPAEADRAGIMKAGLLASEEIGSTPPEDLAEAVRYLFIEPGGTGTLWGLLNGGSWSVGIEQES